MVERKDDCNRRMKMELDIPYVAEILKQQAYILTCSYKTAWEQWMHPIFTENTTFEEVMKHIR
jgi:hypothetical protein